MSDLAIPFELEALASAHRYQAWVGDTIRPYLGKRILEIGAGMGSMSEQLLVRERLVLTEPDTRTLSYLEARVKEWGHPASLVSVARFDPAADPIEPLVAEDFDTIVSFNVLEHVEKDHEVLRRLLDVLKGSRRPSPKRLISFVPAHSWAYGSLDREFGHHRRYSFGVFRRMAREIAPEARFEGRYFNSFGLAGWILSGRILKKKRIGIGSIRAFEALCPLVRPVDTLLQAMSPVPLFGQSLLTVLEI